MNVIRDHSAGLSNSATDAERVAFGRRVHDLRRRRGWTLQRMAQETGLAVSTLSKVERGLMSLTYERLVRLAAGLDTDFSDLFSDGPAAPGALAMAIARSGDVKLLDTGNYRYELLFSELDERAMAPMLGTIRARSIAEFDGYFRHPGQEFLHVLSGRMVLHVEGKPPVALGPGESAYIDSGQGHLYTSEGPEDARILLVCLSRDQKKNRAGD